MEITINSKIGTTLALRLGILDWVINILEWMDTKYRDSCNWVIMHILAIYMDITIITTPALNTLYLKIPPFPSSGSCHRPVWNPKAICMQLQSWITLHSWRICFVLHCKNLLIVGSPILLHVVVGHPLNFCANSVYLVILLANIVSSFPLLAPFGCF
mgnify:CR=1 FL=1